MGAGYLLKTCPTELGLEAALPDSLGPRRICLHQVPRLLPSPVFTQPSHPSCTPTLCGAVVPTLGGGEPLGHLVWLEKGSPKWPRCRCR